MARIVWTEPALKDLEELADYIALDDPGAARKLVRKVFEVVDRLADSPNSGRRPPELQGTQYREKIIGPCRLFYRLEKAQVCVVYIMRGERILRKYLLDERKNTSLG